MAVKVGMVSLGCSKNQVDGEIMLSLIQRDGYELCADPALCDVVIINTCGFIEDAKREWFMACLEDGITIPEPSRLEDYSGQFKLRLPKSLHRLLAQRSDEEGVSMNQYCVYLLSKGIQ